MTTPPETEQLTLLACQINIPAMATSEQRDTHLKHTADKVHQALKNTPADLVVLPELSSIDYSRETFQQLDKLAEALDGASFQVWRSIAQSCNTTILYSFPRRSERGIHISLAAVSPQGKLLGYYDKLHLAQYGASMEKEYFVQGEHLFVFEINGFKLAPMICYDIRLPELSRTFVVDHQADVILHCGAYYRDESFHTWHPFAVTRALENQVYLLSLNRAGEYYGDSLFCCPWMDENRQPMAFPEHSECLKTLTLNRREIKQTRHAYSFLADRRASYDLPLLASGQSLS